MAYILRRSTGVRGECLVNEGFMYQRNKETAKKVYWRCSNPTCRLSLHTNVFAYDQDLRIIHAPDASHHES